jgi:DNA-binding winged helix-turn-helix (wHTH) protein
MRIQFPPFIFDSQRRLVMRGDVAVALTPKAFTLLELLISAAPDPISKEAIYDQLWPGVFVETGNLHNLVSELRTALGDDDHVLIRTVHRIGYAFAAPFVRLSTATTRLLVGDDVIDLPDGETIIGRERLGTPDSSRRHARIVVSGGDVTVEDLGSKNGTFVRGKRIRERAAVSDGDEIMFGRTIATLQVVDTGAPTITASGSRG